MAHRVEVLLVDDVDGTPGDETIRFGVDGVSYEIDLSADNADQLRAAFDPWVEAARRVGGRRKTTPAATPSVDTQAVRAWARQRGYQISDRGRIPMAVLEQYRAAGGA